MAISDGIPAISQLAVGFGGFGPTALDSLEESKQHIQQAEDAIARMHAMEARRRELERAHTSKPRTFHDETDTSWTYVIVDEKVARIVSCATLRALLAIPAEIDGYPVYEIGPEACSRLDSVEEIVCPDSVEVIGACAFRFCSRLRRVVLPENVSEFSVSWLQQCPNLEELVLPGRLETITSAVLDNDNLSTLRIGPHVKTVVPGAFEKTKLCLIDLDSRNSYLSSDGDGLYSHDGTTFVALCKPLEHYDVAQGCVKIAKKACCNIGSLKSVSLPPSLQVIGKFAFAHSGITSVEVPSGVRVIGEKAFFYCRDLESVNLNEGLVRIDDSAFKDSGLKSLRIPASIDRIGTSAVTNSNIVASGKHATISIEPGDCALFLDGSGGLYRREEDGVHLTQLIDPTVRDFTAHAQTRVVDERAFAFNEVIEHVRFSEGLEEIGANAFRVCRSLASAELPDSVRVIGHHAFVDTHLASFRVPAKLEYLGEDALVTAGAHHIGDPPQIKHVEAPSGNTRFRVQDGMLFERVDGGMRVIMFSGEVSDVVVPDGVVNIAAYAFSNARDVRSLSLPASIKTIGTAGLSVWSLIENIHVELAKPIEGRSSFDFKFPATARSIHSISLALGGSSWVNVPDIMAQYDNCIANAHDYQGNGRDSISVYEQVQRVIERLRDPVMLTSVNRKNFNRLLRTHLEEICIDIARHDDRELMEALFEFGYLNEENLEGVISAVGRLQDAAMTGYLLEVKRRRFNKRAFDFDL